jgi:hypothetical protein
VRVESRVEAKAPEPVKVAAALPPATPTPEQLQNKIKELTAKLLAIASGLYRDGAERLLAAAQQTLVTPRGRELQVALDFFGIQIGAKSLAAALRATL